MNWSLMKSDDDPTCRVFSQIHTEFLFRTTASEKQWLDYLHNKSLLFLSFLRNSSPCSRGRIKPHHLTHIAHHQHQHMRPQTNFGSDFMFLSLKRSHTERIKHVFTRVNKPDFHDHQHTDKNIILCDFGFCLLKIEEM